LENHLPSAIVLECILGSASCVQVKEEVRGIANAKFRLKNELTIDLCSARVAFSQPYSKTVNKNSHAGKKLTERGKNLKSEVIDRF
jgi:hypothetical protein